MIAKPRIACRFLLADRVNFTESVVIGFEHSKNLLEAMPHQIDRNAHAVVRAKKITAQTEAPVVTALDRRLLSPRSNLGNSPVLYGLMMR